MMLGNADIVMLTLIDRLALWCIGNPFESFRSNIIIPVDTFIVTVINDLQFKFHFFIVIMQASNKFHGIEISLLYNIIPFYRYLSSTTFGYIFFSDHQQYLLMQSPISRLDFTFCLGEQVIHQISRTRYTAPRGGTLAPHRPDIDPATYISVQHQP